jgi:hypothetical protein
MTNFEKIQKALELVKEVQEETTTDALLQMIIEEDLTRLEHLKKFIKQ